MMRGFVASLALFAATLAYAAAVPPLLPPAFAGWKQTSAAPASPAPEDAAALGECGFVRAVSATYASDAHRLFVRAWQFQDATGAYGAFTFFRQPQTHPASRGSHFVLWHGTTVLDATFAQPERNGQAVLDALATKLPQAEGPRSVPPSLPRYLPTAGLDDSTIRYAIGPIAYKQMGGVLPPGDIGFSEDAEAVTARYASYNATLTLIVYPTPQMAAAHLKTIDTLAKSSGLATKRAGPLLAIVSGNDAKAKPLLDRIHFHDVVTINRPEGYVSEAAKLAQLLLSIATLTGLLIVASLLVAFFLGGGRALVRLARGKPASSVADEEFISLHLN